VTRAGAAVVALSLAGGAAPAAPALALAADRAEPGAPSAPSSGEKPGPRAVEWVGFEAKLGGSPALFGAAIGLGAPRGPADDAHGRWMAWLEADGTDWFRPRRPAGAGRVDRVLWIYPHLEVSQELVRRWSLSGWIEAGPTLGRYTAGDQGESLWFGGAALGAGILLSPVRLGVTWYVQRKSGTARPVDAFASRDVRIAPMLLLTAGLELVTPLPR
jgi:hypothetical protein